MLLLKNEASSPYFVPGEEELKAMTSQLTIMGRKVDHRRRYKADGVIRLQSMDYLEILVLETAGSFAKKDDRKVAFDNAKGMFALLAMLKTIADRYRYGTVDTFQQLKLYFLQPSDKYIRLWSMQYFQNGIYYFVRESKVKVSEEFNDKDKTLAELCNFFYMSKVSMENTFEVLRLLKEEHKAKGKMENNSQNCSLLDVICSRLFSLSYNKQP